MSTRPLLILPLVVALCMVPVPAAAQEAQVIATVAAGAPVTLLPDASRTPLVTLDEGTQVKLLGAAEDGWYRVSFQDSYLWGDRIGYVRAEHVRLAGATPPPTPPASSAVPSNGTGRPRARSGLTDASLLTAISAGRRTGPTPGLRLTDSGANTRFRLEIHTPLAWIQQLARDATRKNRVFGLDDVTDEMTRGVLRVTAYAVSGGGATRAPAVRHVVLRGESSDAFVQPLTTAPYSEHVVRAAGAGTAFEGLRLTFSMDAVRRLRDARADGGLVIVVVGAGGEEVVVRVTKQQLADLSM